MAFNQYDSSSSMKQRIKERQVLHFDEIPIELLNNLNKMGVNDSSLLNYYESAYFNLIFEKSRKDFDFTDKKIGFITGSSGKTKSSKASYFKLEKDRFNSNYSPNGGTLYIFDEAQKEESGGYDAAITYWSKILIPIEDVVKRLKSKK